MVLLSLFTTAMPNNFGLFTKISIIHKGQKFVTLRHIQKNVPEAVGIIPKEELKKIVSYDRKYNLNKGFTCQDDSSVLRIGQHPLRYVYLKINHSTDVVEPCVNFLVRMVMHPAFLLHNSILSHPLYKIGGF